MAEKKIQGERSGDAHERQGRRISVQENMSLPVRAAQRIAAGLGSGEDGVEEYLSP